MSVRSSSSGLPFMIAHDITRRFIQTKPGEQVLILADGESDVDFLHAFAAAIHAHEGEPCIMIMPPTFLEGRERSLPPLVLQALEGADVFIPLVVTTFWTMHDMNLARLMWDKTRPKNLRRFSPGRRHGAGLSGPGLALTLDALRNHDYDKVHEWAVKFCKYLNNGKEIRVASQSGTDLIASIEGVGSAYRPYTGYAREPGQSGSMPSGETGGGPKEFTAEGVIALDGPIAYVAQKPALSQPVLVSIKGGRVTDIKGGEEAEGLKRLIESNENGDVLAEIALGCNPYIKPSGAINITDKNILGTIHVAFGENMFQVYPHGHVWSPVHVDCLLLNPSCWVDGVQLLRDGVPAV